MPGKLEILDMLDWDTPTDKWSWRRVSSVKDDLELKYLTVAQVGKALMKIMKADNRIQMKSTGQCEALSPASETASMLLPG